MFITSILIIVTSIAAFYFSNLEFWIVEAFLSDIEVFLVSVLAFCACPMYRWREKIATSLFMSFYIFTAIHNILIYKNILTGVIPATLSAILIIVFVFILGNRLFNKWDSLPSEDMKEGYLYEIIGKPKRDINFLAFLISFGRGGSWAISDGVRVWRFDSTSKLQVCEDVTDGFIFNKKVVKIGVRTDKEIDRLNAGNGKRWTLFNNCLTKFRFGL